ncbi:MAG TPA: ATP-binding protein [Geobacteraceae bacterium]|nr:ATP-binding protein [Geobacteraceae bacterium]
MTAPGIETMLEQLIAVAENLSMGRYGDHDRIFAMTDSDKYHPFVARFAEAFAMMAVKIEAREFRLEQMIDDLKKAKDDLTVANEKLQQSLRDLQLAQMQLIQQEKMESVGRLAAGVAHEVKNPLAVIQLGVDFLANQLEGNPLCHETVMDMADAVQRADRVIKGMLDFSRSEQLELQPADIDRVIDDSLILVRHELTTRRIKVNREEGGDIPRLMLDGNKIKQVFINLFMNAMHAMEEGGTLTISSALRTVMSEDLAFFGLGNGLLATGEKAVLVRVADTGTGIGEEAKAKLFDPFFTTKPVGIGTGLGLSVTRKILELHQGFITLANRADRQGAEAVMLYTLFEQKAEDNGP